jgi:hypothetical protein
VERISKSDKNGPKHNIALDRIVIHDFSISVPHVTQLNAARRGKGRLYERSVQNISSLAQKIKKYIFFFNNIITFEVQ